MDPKSFASQDLDRPPARTARGGLPWKWAVVGLSGLGVVLAVTALPDLDRAEAQFGGMGGTGGMMGPMGPPRAIFKFGDHYINLAAVTYVGPAGDGLRVHFIGTEESVVLNGDDAEAFRRLIEGPEVPPGEFKDEAKKGSSVREEFRKKLEEKVKKDLLKKEFLKKKEHEKKIEIEVRFPRPEPPGDEPKEEPKAE